MCKPNNQNVCTHNIALQEDEKKKKETPKKKAKKEESSEVRAIASNISSN